MYERVVDDVDPLSVSLRDGGSDSGYRIDCGLSRWVPMSGFESPSEETCRMVCYVSGRVDEIRKDYSNG